MGPVWSREHLKAENFSQLWSEREVPTEEDADWRGVTAFQDEGRDPWAKEVGDL